MLMFLMVLCFSLFALGVTCMAFGAATRSERESPAAQPERDKVNVPSRPRFFAGELVDPPMIRPQIPVEALLLQIEKHVRLEQAAAESFIAAPSVDLLRSKTISPLVQ